uniref:Carotene biosynthesis-related protein n=1 Tax=Ulva fasciata TaxID=111617 RepID=C7SBJ5_9CHLO|nr:carotene biosynthesis-related protein [Ulva fasciata]
MFATSISSQRMFARAQARARTVSARAEPVKPETTPAPEETPAAPESSLASAGISPDAPAEAVATPVLGRTQELINSHAAMLGIVAAVGSEIFSGQSVWSQIAGKYIDGEVVEKAHGNSTLFFGAVVVIITMTTLTPKFLGDNPSVEDKEFGPFTATAETINGRLAMMGFFSLLVVEFFKQSPIF